MISELKTDILLLRLKNPTEFQRLRRYYHKQTDTISELYAIAFDAIYGLDIATFTASLKAIHNLTN